MAWYLVADAARPSQSWVPINGRETAPILFVANAKGNMVMCLFLLK